MMTAMREILVSMGVPDAEVLQEAFVSPASGAAAVNGQPAAAASSELAVDGATGTIVFTKTGRTAELPAEQSVLEAAEASGVEIPFECRSGICGQCKTRLTSGRVAMDVQDALTAADRMRGLILACQAHAIGPIEVDA
jgi:ferredoxin